jgi:ketosteroid isomerase-like protein
VTDRVAEHVRRFDAAMSSGDWPAFVAGFTPDAVMTFEGVPAGPFVGRDAILAGYLAQPPTASLTVTWVDTDGETDVASVGWHDGGTGTMAITWRDGQVARLAIAFD